MRVKSLHIYPLKSARGVEVGEIDLRARGPRGDRRWMAVDENGKFLSQRTCPALAKINAVVVDDGETPALRLWLDGGEAPIAARAPAPDEEGDIAAARRAPVAIWRSTVEALDAGEAAADWLSRALARPARLYYMDAAAHRQTAEEWGPPQPVSFADGFPLLVTTAASLDALNAEISGAGRAPVPMSRFRPNIVIDESDPWTEDLWTRLRIGDCEIELVKPCVRCVMTTLEPQSGESCGEEPLKTLMRLRRSADRRAPGVLFGWNATPREVGKIRVGDSVRILEARSEGWPLAVLNCE